MENGQPVVTQLNLEDILLNNNNVSPRQVGQILRALGDELDNAFKFPPRISKSGWTRRNKKVVKGEMNIS